MYRMPYIGCLMFLLYTAMNASQTTNALIITANNSQSNTSNPKTYSMKYQSQPRRLNRKEGF